MKEEREVREVWMSTVKLGLEVVMANINKGGTEVLIRDQRCGVLPMGALIQVDRVWLYRKMEKSRMVHEDVNERVRK